MIYKKGLLPIVEEAIAKPILADFERSIYEKLEPSELVDAEIRFHTELGQIDNPVVENDIHAYYEATKKSGYQREGLIIARTGLTVHKMLKAQADKERVRLPKVSQDIVKIINRSCEENPTSHFGIILGENIFGKTKDRLKDENIEVAKLIAAGSNYFASRFLNHQAYAIICGTAVYLLLEKQAEADKMEKEFKK